MEPWKEITWTEFCVWLQGRRVVQDHPIDEEKQELIFSDGFSAILQSVKSDPTRGYSEYTPGSDGHLLVPVVKVSVEALYPEVS